MEPCIARGNLAVISERRLADKPGHARSCCCGSMAWFVKPCSQAVSRCYYTGFHELLETIPAGVTTSRPPSVRRSRSELYNLCTTAHDSGVAAPQGGQGGRCPPVENLPPPLPPQFTDVTDVPSKIVAFYSAGVISSQHAVIPYSQLCHRRNCQSVPIYISN